MRVTEEWLTFLESKKSPVGAYANGIGRFEQRSLTGNPGTGRLNIGWLNL